MKQIVTLILIILYIDSPAQSCHALGSGLSGPCKALCIVNGNLYAAGGFYTAGGTVVYGIAEWNGAQWLPLGPGLGPAQFFSTYFINALCSYNGSLYAGGVLDSLGGVAITDIGGWNGNSWFRLAGNIPASLPGADNITALTTYNGNLIAAGYFYSPDSNSAMQWNGTSWSAMGNGFWGRINTFAVYQQALYAGGTFGLARWDDTSWTLLAPITTGITGEDGGINAICNYNGNLCVAGVFDSIGGAAAHSIAQWDGMTWTQVGPGLPSLPGFQTMAVYDSAIYVSWTTGAGGSSDTTDAALARWNGTEWASINIIDNVNTFNEIYTMLAENDTLFIGGSFSSACDTTAGSGIVEITGVPAGTPIPTEVQQVNKPGAVECRVFPDPNDGEFSVSLKNTPEECIISIFNITGRQVAQQRLNTGITGIHVNASPGIYFYRVITNGEDGAANGKFVIQ